VEVQTARVALFTKSEIQTPRQSPDHNTLLHHDSIHPASVSLQQPCSAALSPRHHVSPPNDWKTGAPSHPPIHTVRRAIHPSRRREGVFRTWSLRAHSQLIPFPHDQAIALFFFPKANTMGCTKEACAFRDARQDNPTFKRYGDDKLVVIGVSGGESSLLSLRATTTDAHRHQTPHPLNPRSSISTTSDTLS
jgi:hypothetical protein